MYHVTVRDHMMIAHSLPGAAFGPAQALHGATYVVDVTFYRPILDDNDLVVDIAVAHDVVHEILGAFNLSNLDEHGAFAGRHTTTEFMAGVIFERMRAAIGAGRFGDGGAGLTRLGVRLSESHIAWAGYEAPL